MDQFDRIGMISTNLHTVYLHMVMHDAHTMGLISDDQFKQYLKSVMLESAKGFERLNKEKEG